jgi:hypothetical protein
MRPAAFSSLTLRVEIGRWPLQSQKGSRPCFGPTSFGHHTCALPENGPDPGPWSLAPIPFFPRNFPVPLGEWFRRGVYLATTQTTTSGIATLPGWNERE